MGAAVGAANRTRKRLSDPNSNPDTASARGKSINWLPDTECGEELELEQTQFKQAKTRFSNQIRFLALKS